MSKKVTPQERQEMIRTNNFESYELGPGGMSSQQLHKGNNGTTNLDESDLTHNEPL